MSARLVRDKMTDVPWRSDVDAKRWLRRVHNIGEHAKLLARKGLEEMGEAITANGEAELISELADLHEVLLAVAHINDVPWDAVEEYASRKRDLYGGFTEGLVWDTPGDQ